MVKLYKQKILLREISIFSWFKLGEIFLDHEKNSAVANMLEIDFGLSHSKKLRINSLKNLFRRDARKNGESSEIKRTIAELT